MIVRIFIRRTCTISKTRCITGFILHFRKLVTVISVSQIVNQGITIALQLLDIAILVILSYFFGIFILVIIVSIEHTVQASRWNGTISTA